ncbi:hypothetical protein [Flaviaesturariibacter amylovorans]|uniref:DUF4878 domain-containing protein n=1 Tax=Flaviaesturariibacter amylovorans TaxID=1084520 RepID=A0ABP8HGD3_9BACT
MNRIFYVLALALVGAGLASCNSEKAPKAVATEFVEQLYGLNWTEAAALSDPAAQGLIDKSRDELSQRTALEQEKAHRKSASVATLFDVASLTEETAGDISTVKNGTLRLPLRKVDGQWKVVPDAELVDALVNHPYYLDLVQQSWQQLQAEYDKRTIIARDLVTSRLNSGDQSAEVKALATAVQECAAAKAGTAAERTDYLARQRKLEALLDKGLQPTLTAASDLSLNYIVQLTNAQDRIRELGKTYTDAARKARSRDYPPTP